MADNVSVSTAPGSAEVAKPLASFAPARHVRVSQDLHLLYISGTTARQPGGQIPPFGLHNKEAANDPSAAEVQADVILSKIAKIIKDASGGRYGLEALLELTIFVRDLQKDYGAVNKVWNSKLASVFDEKGMPLPARTCVEVSALPPDGRTRVEMKGMAGLSVTDSNGI